MSLDVDSLKVFTRVAELKSFTQAAEQLGMPRSRASAHVKRLEEELGARLLQRTTRHVHLTPEGEELLTRARSLLADADEIAHLFQQGRTLRGRVRVELPVLLAREIVIPRVPELLARHPLLYLDISTSDRVVSALRGGFDLVIRIGPVHEPELVGRRIGEAVMRNAASPAYLRKYGTPRSLEALSDHFIVHYASDPEPLFEYEEGETRKVVPMRSMITVDSIEAYEAAGLAGLGIVQLPRDEQRLSGEGLVEILPGFSARPSPVWLLHTHGDAAPRRVRAVMSWLEELLLSTIRERTTSSHRAP